MSRLLLLTFVRNISHLETPSLHWSTRSLGLKIVLSWVKVLDSVVVCSYFFVMLWGNIYGLCGMPYEYILRFLWYVFSVHYQDINFQPTLSSRCLSWFITKWMRDFLFSMVMFNFSNHLPSLLSSSLTILPHTLSFFQLLASKSTP